MDFDRFNPLHQFQPTLVTTQGDLLLNPSASISNLTFFSSNLTFAHQPCGFFQGFDEADKKSQTKTFKKMMHNLKDYILENKQMEHYFEEHDMYTKDFIEGTAFDMPINPAGKKSYQQIEELLKKRGCCGTENAKIETE